MSGYTLNYMGADAREWIAEPFDDLGCVMREARQLLGQNGDLRLIDVFEGAHLRYRIGRGWVSMVNTDGPRATAYAQGVLNSAQP